MLPTVRAPPKLFKALMASIWLQAKAKAKAK
jgi:hypothetical protein